jgi:hypothetical protein
MHEKNAEPTTSVVGGVGVLSLLFANTSTIERAQKKPTTEVVGSEVVRVFCVRARTDYLGSSFF